MSSIIPRALVPKLGRLIERHLSLRRWDALNQFWIGTRLIFSRAILLLVAALFVFFSWIALVRNSVTENDAFGILSVQTVILAVLLNMNLWEIEREGRTFELLIMRIPSLNRLIWFKLRISLFWLVFLPIPFFAAFAWFFSIPFFHILLYFVFTLSYALLVCLVTCVVASFVHHGLTSGIVTFVLSAFAMAFFKEAHGLPYRDYYSLYKHPFEFATGLSTAQTAWRMIVNRCFLLLVAAGFYAWLRRRLGKTEKWIR